MNRQELGESAKRYLEAHRMTSSDTDRKLVNLSRSILRPRERWVVDTKDAIPVSEWPANIDRASGSALCSWCNTELDLHYQPAKETCPTLVVDCLDNWWKL